MCLVGKTGGVRLVIVRFFLFFFAIPFFFFGVNKHDGLARQAAVLGLSWFFPLFHDKSRVHFPPPQQVKQKVHVAKKTVDPAFECKREQFRAVQKAVDKFTEATEGQRKALRGVPAQSQANPQ